MKVVFVSNYFNHHQKPFSDAMYQALGDEYIFVETNQMPQFRENLGYQKESLPPYVMPYELTKGAFEQVEELINEADVVIIGEAHNKYIEKRRKQEKLIIRYSERLFKNRLSIIKYLPQLLKQRSKHKGKNTYLLCASAYAARDFKKFGLFKGKSYKWGYFPETRTYESIDELIDKKEKNSIIWAGRFIEWKHPEACVEVAKRLKDDGYEFTFYMAGIGNRRNVRELAQEYGVWEHFVSLGGISPNELRGRMEAAEIMLFTSSRKEGWGAVLNEAMNSACAVVASDAAGSTGYLVEHEKNGLVYESGSIDQLYKCVKFLLDCSEKRKRLSKNAYETIRDEWNAEVGAKRLLKLLENIQNNQEMELYQHGPCSKA